MNKLKYIIIGIIVVAAAAAVGYFAFRKGDAAYVGVVPADAQAVVRLDVAALIDDADLSAEEATGLVSRIFDTDAQMETGLDFSRPLYAFMASTGNMGLVAAVDSHKDLTAACEQLRTKGHCEELSQQRGYTWTVFGGQWLMAFDEEKALVMGPAVGAAQDQLRTEMAGYLKGESRQVEGHTALTSLLGTADEPLVAVVKPDVLPADYRKTLAPVLGDTSEALLRVAASADDSELELESEMIDHQGQALTPSGKLGQLLRPIKGDLIGQSHANTCAWLCVNIKGDEIIGLLREEPTLRLALIMLNMAVDADAIIKAVDGDVALDLAGDAYSGQSLNYDYLPVMLTARLANEDFLSQADYWLKSQQSFGRYRLSAVSKSDFTLMSGDVQYGFGVHDKTFYVQSDASLGTLADGHAPNAYLNEERDDIEGLRLYATVDLRTIMPTVGSVTGFSSPLAQQLERATVEMKRPGHLRLKLSATDDVNIIRLLLVE